MSMFTQTKTFFHWYETLNDYTGFLYLRDIAKYHKWKNKYLSYLTPRDTVLKNQ